MEEFPSIQDFLASNRKLKELDLENCKLTTGGLINIALGLQENDTLRTLNLSKNLIKLESLQAFAETLANQNFPRLKKVVLKKCGLEDVTGV